MLLVIQTVYVYGNVYAKKNIKISLNDQLLLVVFFPPLLNKQSKKQQQQIIKHVAKCSFIFMDTIVHIILDCQ